MYSTAFLSDDPAAALMHGPTYMANALACAAANASLDLFEREPRLAQVAAIEAQLRAELEPCREIAGVADVRVKGAIGAVELSGTIDLHALRRRFVELGVWLRPFGSVVYLMPPFVVTPAELATLTAAVRRVLAERAASPADGVAARHPAAATAGRARRRPSPAPAAAVSWRGRRIARRGRPALVDASSNDYLGLSQHPLVKARAAEWAQRHGAGAPASRLVTGTRDITLAVEEKLAAFKGREAALLFSSGFQANATVIPALARLGSAEKVGAGDTANATAIFSDELNHASIIHGARARAARSHVFRHNDLDHLDDLLGRHAGRKLIVTESVFSMDGDRADLAALVRLAERHGARCMSTKPMPPACSGRRGAALRRLRRGRTS
jgi:hypothetical protein